MITRHQQQRLQQLMQQFPIVGLIGPRQCGKTTMAKLWSKQQAQQAIYFDLESPLDVRNFSDAEFFLLQLTKEKIIIDEVQRLPELFPLLRSLIDKHKRKGRFLLLGSASPQLIKGASESLAGRIAYIEAHPFNITEVYKSNNDIQRHWFRGGFPDAFLSKNDMNWFNWMDSFFKSFIERDLNTLFGGVTFSPQLMFKLWRMLAHFHGGIWNAQSFAKSLDVSPTTINKYVDYLEGAFVLRKLMPYYTNSKKRLVKSPKIYIRDSGLLHYLLDITEKKTLLYHNAIGNSWEGYVIEQVLQLLPNTIQAYFYRTHDGSEMDLVLVKGIKPFACIEIKTTNQPVVSRGLTQSILDLETKHNFIITPEQAFSYKLKSTIEVYGLLPFLQEKLPKLCKQ